MLVRPFDKLPHRAAAIIAEIEYPPNIHVRFNALIVMRSSTPRRRRKHATPASVAHTNTAPTSKPSAG
ncbi:hypothetical protein WS68_00410 [Burkholderia sp. TSV86]|nr:hypothetical protein WS68_00410 [Burkholderia sp. TSV86]